jgi:hypothetical protein
MIRDAVIKHASEPNIDPLSQGHMGLLRTRSQGREKPAGVDRRACQRPKPLLFSTRRARCDC